MPQGAIYTDNVFPYLERWTTSDSLRCALITLVGIDGASPRALGAQMAVAEDGRYAGYISGGCLEQAIALEAVAAIEANAHRLVRYGKDSPYFDIRLPCGSGLDLFIQPMPDRALIDNVNRRIKAREKFALTINLAQGSAEVLIASDPQPNPHDADIFIRPFTPPLRCLVIGSSPIAISLVTLGLASDFEVLFYTSDTDSPTAQIACIEALPLRSQQEFPTDKWTAALLAFHDHEQEIPVFTQLLKSDCFHIAAIGSRKAHHQRELALQGEFTQEEIARIKSPAGLISGLKTAPHVALSILAELVSVARQQHLLSE